MTTFIFAVYGLQIFLITWALIDEINYKNPDIFKTREDIIKAYNPIMPYKAILGYFYKITVKIYKHYKSL